MNRAHFPSVARKLRQSSPQLLILFLHATAVGGFVAVEVVPFVLELQVTTFAAVGVLDGDVGGQGGDGVAEGDFGAAAELGAGAVVPDAPGEMLHLFPIAAADRTLVFGGLG